MALYRVLHVCIGYWVLLYRVLHVWGGIYGHCVYKGKRKIAWPSLA